MPEIRRANLPPALLARMLGGQTEAARKHAEEMLRRGERIENRR